MPPSLALCIAPQVLDRQQPEDAKPDPNQKLRDVPARRSRVLDEQVGIIDDRRDAECEHPKKIQPPEPRAIAGPSCQQRNSEQQPCGDPDAIKWRQNGDRLAAGSSGRTRPRDRGKATAQDREAGFARPATQDHQHDYQDERERTP